MRSFATTYMRGGTSKGCMFLRNDLPAEQKEWEDIFLQVMGDPDPKQIDGLGGTVSSNNKIVVVWPSKDPAADVEYLVGQVIVGQSKVDYKSNCGNMTAAVGPFAVEKGLIAANGDRVSVRLLNRNTDKYITVTVPVRDGRFDSQGDCAIAGVDGTASRLEVAFLDPAGAKTGKLLPTGSPMDILDIPGLGPVEATIIDVANPLVLVRAADIGLVGVELPDQINADERALNLLEHIRAAACWKMGFVNTPADAAALSPAVPKVGFVAPAVGYQAISGEIIAAASMDLCARVVSVFKLHKAIPLTAALATGTAARIPGTVVNRLFAAPGKSVRIGHPEGVIEVEGAAKIQGNQITLDQVSVIRTARIIMEGRVFVGR